MKGGRSESYHIMKRASNGLCARFCIIVSVVASVPPPAYFLFRENGIVALMAKIIFGQKIHFFYMCVLCLGLEARLLAVGCVYGYVGVYVCTFLGLCM